MESGKWKIEPFFYKVAEALEATLLERHHINPTTTTIKYGAANKYKIPVFNPVAMLLLPFETVLSTVVLHMAHCAKVSILLKQVKTIVNKVIWNILRIIW